MKVWHQEALNGTLPDRRDDSPLVSKRQLINRLPFSLRIWISDGVDRFGIRRSEEGAELGTVEGIDYPDLELMGDEAVLIEGLTTIHYLMVYSLWSGAFMGAIDMEYENHLPIGDAMYLESHIDSKLLLPPNHIGRVPKPTNSAIIPQNSPHIIVGFGKAKNNNIIFHEQYWQLQHNSYALAAGEEKTVSYTLFMGIRETSSEEKTVAESLDVSVAGGWGPVSASVSASISQTTNRRHELTLTTEKTIFVSDTIRNDDDEKRTKMILLWQLTDVINVYNSEGNLLATVEHGNAPLVIGSHYIEDLPD